MNWGEKTENIEMSTVVLVLKKTAEICKLSTGYHLPGVCATSQYWQCEKQLTA